MTIELDHIGVSVSDYEKAKAFYAAALAPLRMIAIMEFSSEETGNEPVVGFGADDKPFLWISGGGRTVPHTHVAIRAESRGQVDAFYAAALAAGGSDNGPPGLRPHYHEHYYGAFVLDPDGHNLEAVVHTPPAAAKAARKPARKSAKSSRRASAKKPARASTGKPAKRAAKKPARAAARKPAKRAAAKQPARKAAAKKPARRGRKK